MKTKLISLLVALVAALLVPISPASASGASWAGSVIVIPVGQAYQGTFDCGEINNTEAYFDNGVLPPGLTLAGTGVVSGTPTTPGTYELSGFHCTFNGGYGGYMPNVHLTFTIQPAATPAPDVVLRNRNNSDCEFSASFVFPATPDAGTARYIFMSNAGESLLVLQEAAFDFGAPLVANKIYDIHMPITRLNELTTTFNLPGYNGSTVPFACGDELQFSVGYQSGSAPVSTKQSAFVSINTNTDIDLRPLLTMRSLGTSDCQFNIAYSFPGQPDRRSISIAIENQAGTKLTVNTETETSDVLTTNQIYEGPVPIATLNELPSFPDFSGSLEGETPFACGDSLTVTMSYKNYGTTYTRTIGPQTITAATVETPPAPRLYANQRTDQKCSVDIVYPITNIEAGSKLTLRQENADLEDASLVFAGAAMPGGLLTATLSLNNGGDNRANTALRAANATYLGCTGNWYVAYYNAAGEKQAEVLLGLTKNIPLCNSGFTSNTAEYTCVPTPLGFYTTQLSQEIATPCPAGMTTLTTASRSINDCYMPIVQSITAFKAPKAIKLKGTALLNVITNTKAQVTYTATGACTAKIASITTKVKGKKVTTKQLKLTAAKKAGNCSVTLSSPAVGKYLALSQTVKIKVSKTGK